MAGKTRHSHVNFPHQKTYHIQNTMLIFKPFEWLETRLVLVSNFTFQFLRRASPPQAHLTISCKRTPKPITIWDCVECGRDIYGRAATQWWFQLLDWEALGKMFRFLKDAEKSWESFCNNRTPLLCSIYESYIRNTYLIGENGISEVWFSLLLEMRSQHSSKYIHMVKKKSTQICCKCYFWWNSWNIGCNIVFNFLYLTACPNTITLSIQICHHFFIVSASQSQ